MNPLISVIVPIYNVENYLCRCVDSIINQTYTNLEIILVDDGSPDGCPAICDEYAQKDNRIRVIHKENGGLSDARNAGLDNATGDYISFVDSDDFIADNYYSSFADNFPFEVAICGLKIVDENLQLIELKEACKQPQLLSFESDYVLISELINSSLFGYSVNKLFNFKIINEIRFKDFQLREDFIFVINTVSTIKNVLLVPSNGYYYIQHNSSLLHASYSGNIPNISAILPELYTIHPLLSYNENRKIVNRVIKFTLLDSLRKFVFFNNSLTKKEKKKYIKDFFNNITLRKFLCFSLTDGMILNLFTTAYKFQLPSLFFTIMKRIWINE